MSDAFRFGILAFTSLLAIVNPIGAVPMYIAMTTSYSRDHRTRTLRRAILTAFIVLCAFTLLGTYILRFFGIGWDMLQARRSRVKTTEEEETEGASKDDVGIIPLGLPTLAGPGAITTVIALNGQAETLARQAFVYAAITAVLVICWLLLAAAPAVTRRVSQTGMNVFTRLMGLLVMVVGAQFVINGVTVVILDIAQRLQ